MGIQVCHNSSNYTFKICAFHLGNKFNNGVEKADFPCKTDCAENHFIQTFTTASGYTHESCVIFKTNPRRELNSFFIFIVIKSDLYY